MANDLVISDRRLPALSRNLARLMKPRDLEDFKRSPLVPAGDLPRVKAELAIALRPCEADDAVKLAAILVGSYPKHTIDDPAIYTRGIVSLMQEYPPSVVSAAVDKLTRKCRFVPSRAELSEELERLMGQLRWAQFVADRTAEEGRRRRRIFEEAQAAEASRRDFMLRHGGKSPLDVLRSKGLYNSEREEDDGKEAISGSRQAHGGNAGRPDKARSARRNRQGGDRSATGG